MLDLAALKEVASFHEGMSLFKAFFLLTETTESNALFIHKVRGYRNKGKINVCFVA